MPSNPIPQVSNNFLTAMNMPSNGFGMPNLTIDSPSDMIPLQMQIYGNGGTMVLPQNTSPLSFSNLLSTDTFAPVSNASLLQTGTMDIPMESASSSPLDILQLESQVYDTGNSSVALPTASSPLSASNLPQTGTMGLPADSTYGELMNFATSIDQQLGAVMNTPLNLNASSTSTTPTPPAMPSGSASQSFTAAPVATGPVSQEQQKIISNAEQYLDFNTNNASQRQRINNEIWQGNPNSEGWCAQFVAAALRETYGSKSPLGSSWDQGVIYGNPGAPYRPKGQMPQPGDVVHLNGAKDSNGWSCGNEHVAIVTKVYPDGSFDTIEGGLTSNGGTGVYAKHYNASTLQNPKVGFQDVAGFMASKSG